MSCHNYASLGMITQCTELCHLAQNRLCGIDQTIEYLQKNASLLINEDVDGLMIDLQKSKAELLEKIKLVSSSVHADMSYEEVRQLTNRATSLLHESNDVGIVRMGAIKKMVRESLDSSIQEHRKELERQSKGYAKKRTDLNLFLESISDSEVRGMVRILVRNPAYNDLSLEDIIKLAEKRLHPEVVFSLQEEEAIKGQISADLKEHKIDEKIIFSASKEVASLPKNILELINASDEVIISETVRKKAINSIISNIRNRGFFVETKNIRFIREENMVKITALKPGGQKAEFNVYLDGSFVYKFDEYEGQACQKDISEFVEDLNSIYGIKIGNIREEWSNPDKSSKMSYQKADVLRRG